MFIFSIFLGLFCFLTGSVPGFAKGMAFFVEFHFCYETLVAGQRLFNIFR